MSSELKELDALLSDINNHQMLLNGVDDHVDSRSTAPLRPPPPKNYDIPIRSQKWKIQKSSTEKNTLSIPNRPPPPPKLEHALKDKRHDLIKATHHDDGILRAPDMKSDSEDDYDSGSLVNSSIREDKVDAGEAPRGDKSMVIKTDYGEMKSKYNYLGFGLWENTEPDEPPPPPRKLSPPPPPPKSEPVWYNCTVSVESHKTSKELDDLEQVLNGHTFQTPDKERAIDLSQTPGFLGDLYEKFEKEDMSDMFRRAFLEKMSMDNNKDQKKVICFVCSELIHGRIITALTHKFHPECFVCAYCKKQFKNRCFKTDIPEKKPYCYECFEKLLGHFGDVRSLA